MDKAQILMKLAEIHAKLEETRDAAVVAGPFRDVMKVVIPMMEDMLDVVRHTVNLIED